VLVSPSPGLAWERVPGAAPHGWGMCGLVSGVSETCPCLFASLPVLWRKRYLFRMPGDFIGVAK